MRPDAATPRRYFETVRRLQPEQIWHQVRRRLLLPWRRAAAAQPPADLRLASSWGAQVQRCRPPLERSVLSGRFRFWGEERQLDLQRPWLAADQGPSWNYPVHYFDALPGLVDASEQEPDLLAAILAWLDSWLCLHPPGSAIAWEPYPTALRLVNWTEALQGFGDRVPAAWQQAFRRSLYVQAAWLERRLERHLLGTHLLKDVKALLVTSTVFADAGTRAWRDRAQDLLLRELRRHVHADGSHAEPSPMYHCTALEDLLDLLNFRGALDATATREVTAVAQRMLAYAQGLQTPTGDYPLLGDAWPGGAPNPAQLTAYARRLGVQDGAAPPETPELRLFPDAGVLVWRDPGLYVVADVGEMGPPHLAAHGHCDSLSFELWCDGEPVIVDSGTFTYEAGDRRHACRATAAHNTPQIDAREQHEIWAAFRVGRRSTVRRLEQRARGLDVVLVPWFEPRIQVQRRFEFAPGSVQVVDRVVGPGSHRIASRLHLHPRCQVESRSRSGLLLRCGSGRVALEWSGHVEAELATVRTPRYVGPGESQSFFAVPWGTLQPNAVLQLDLQGELPCRSTLVLRRLSGPTVAADSP